MKPKSSTNSTFKLTHLPFIYTKTHTVALSGPDSSGNNGQFGNRVSIDDSGTLVVGAYIANKAYVYYGCTSSSSSTCNDINRVTLTGPLADSGFGFSLGVNGNAVLVGAPKAKNYTGAAYIYYGTLGNAATPSGKSYFI